MKRPYLDNINTPYKVIIAERLAEHDRRLQQPKKGILRFKEVYESMRHFRAESIDCSCDKVVIGAAGQLPDRDQQLVLKAMRSFMPWRKGPFQVFGIDIDAEWQSSRKWQRVLPALPDLEGKVIADVGCSNGYYMFRMSRHNPRCVIGFEPYLQHYFTFKTLNAFAGLDNLFVELFGVEDMGLFEGTFDVVFLMGILYHRISPLECLREIRKSMRQGGTLIVESQGIPGEEPVALFPETRYAKVPGTYFVPTASCLKNWLLRAGFKNVEIFDSHPMSNIEQRKTDWMTFESYDDFIDPANPALTIEGYPAPIRVFLKGLA